MSDGFTIICLICGGAMALIYAWGAIWHVVDAWRYINSGAIDEKEFAYENYGVRGKHVRRTSRTAGRHVCPRVRRPRRTVSAPDARPGWVYSTML